MIRITKLMTLLTAVMGLIGATACTDPAAVEEIRAGIKDLKQQQGTVLDKVSNLEKGQKDMADKMGQMRAPQAPTPPPEPTGPFEVTSTKANIKGDPKAPVSIVEWSDFQCPFCSKVKPIIDDTLKDPEVAGKVNFVFKQFPLSFHQNAMPAAIAVMAAGKQGKFFEMHDKVFDNQRDLSPELFVKLAQEVGLDVEKFKKDLNDPEIPKQIQEEMAEGSKVGVRGTPTLYIGVNKGDKFIVEKANGRSVEFYKEMIKTALQKAAQP